MPWERVALTVQAREQRRITYEEIGPSVLDGPFPCGYVGRKIPFHAVRQEIQPTGPCLCAYLTSGPDFYSSRQSRAASSFTN
jgi:hypothetical protein